MQDWSTSLKDRLDSVHAGAAITIYVGVTHCNGIGAVMYRIYLKPGRREHCARRADLAV